MSTKIPTVKEWMHKLESDIFVCPICGMETDIEVTWYPETGEDCTDENIEIICLNCGGVFGAECGKATRAEIEGALKHDIWKCEKCKQKYVKWWCSNWGKIQGNFCQHCFTDLTGKLPADVSYCDKEGDDYYIRGK
jgi:hypothetical protein